MNPQDIVRKHLNRLRADLDNYFEQTTHGCLGPFTIESVCLALQRAYNDPTVYNLSTLSQHIHGFLKS